MKKYPNRHPFYGLLFFFLLIPTACIGMTAADKFNRAEILFIDLENNQGYKPDSTVTEADSGYYYRCYTAKQTCIGVSLKQGKNNIYERKAGSSEWLEAGSLIAMTDHIRKAPAVVVGNNATVLQNYIGKQNQLIRELTLADVGANYPIVVAAKSLNQEQLSKVSSAYIKGLPIGIINPTAKEIHQIAEILNLPDLVDLASGDLLFFGLQKPEASGNLPNVSYIEAPHDYTITNQIGKAIGHGTTARSFTLPEVAGLATRWIQSQNTPIKTLTAKTLTAKRLTSSGNLDSVMAAQTITGSFFGVSGSINQYTLRLYPLGSTKSKLNYLYWELDTVFSATEAAAKGWRAEKYTVKVSIPTSAGVARATLQSSKPTTTEGATNTSQSESFSVSGGIDGMGIEFGGEVSKSVTIETSTPDVTIVNSSRPLGASNLCEWNYQLAAKALVGTSTYQPLMVGSWNFPVNYSANQPRPNTVALLLGMETHYTGIDNPGRKAQVNMQQRSIDSNPFPSKL